MTLPSGPTLSLNQINGEFGRGYDLNTYRGVRWWYDNAFTGTFPTGTIAINDFYSKRSTSPVVGNTYGPYGPGTTAFTVPAYTVLTILARGGGGGGSGYPGVNTCAWPTVVTTANWDAGGYGGNTSVYGQTATGGAGGATGGPGGGPSNDGGTPGGGGGVGGASGGYVQFQVVNPVLGGTGPTVGSTIGLSIGGGGGGGGGARNYGLQYQCVWLGAWYCANVCVEVSRAGTGGGGANGSVTITVS